MSIIVTYDLDSMWTEVKQTALHNGFDEFLYADDGSIFHLPNTTLKCLLSNRLAAMDKFRAVVRYVSPFIKVRVVAFEWNEARLFNNLTKNTTELT